MVALNHVVFEIWDVKKLLNEPFFVRTAELSFLDLTLSCVVLAKLLIRHLIALELNALHLEKFFEYARNVADVLAGFITFVIISNEMNHDLSSCRLLRGCE